MAEEQLCSEADLEFFLNSKYAGESSDIGIDDFRRICKAAACKGDPFIHGLSQPPGGADLNVMPIMEFLAHAATIGAFLLAYRQNRRSLDRDNLVDDIVKGNPRYQREMLLKLLDELNDESDTKQPPKA